MARADERHEEIVRAIEAETHDYYRRHHADFRDRGYHVMYGPPIRGAPILFAGYQPGGPQRTDDHRRSAGAGAWPALPYYATEDWPLALRLQAMFGTELLRRCTGLNAVFFRSPKIATYANEVSVARRRDAAIFSVERATRLIAALGPKLVVAIGLTSFRLFGPTTSSLANARGRTLLIEGAIAGVPAIGTLHLSGARIASIDRNAMADAILTQAMAA
jgi:hypothetical protein